MSWRDSCVSSLPYYSMNGGGLSRSSHIGNSYGGYLSSFIPAPTPAPFHYTTGKYGNNEETTAKQLSQIVFSTKTHFKALPGYEGSSHGFDRLSLGVDCDEVYPNLFIGDEGSARNKTYLRRLGITHVVNTAEGNRFGMVNTDAHFYRSARIHYLGLPMLDLPTTNIEKYFHTAADFIDDGIKSGGKVLVHCLMGMSRSSTIAIAYLMIKAGMPASMALRMCRQNRNIHPNEGFLQQLADLDNRLRRGRERVPYSSYSSSLAARTHRL
ncbi:dual specificity protein phosphatase 3 isoform X1 [Frankliniella occidentalis]|uniref:protein-serine/threonine phosphatase n=1 Tax=Frankliniella occidentalis TaxID=133901 RepID=A0A6J1SWE9_FRAOC|nr:dual specificity protein phosphatase 3 isoform X1 [Frankliniella occidentalis]